MDLALPTSDFPSTRNAHRSCPSGNPSPSLRCSTAKLLGFGLRRSLQVLPSSQKMQHATCLCSLWRILSLQELPNPPLPPLMRSESFPYLLRFFFKRAAHISFPLYDGFLRQWYCRIFLNTIVRNLLSTQDLPTGKAVAIQNGSHG